MAEVINGRSLLACPDCGRLPCRNPKRALDDCCACCGEVCGDCTCPAIELVTCEVCGNGDREHELLLCDGCDHACHLSCMHPVLRIIPALWFCLRCKTAALEQRRRTESNGTPGGLSTNGLNSIVRHAALHASSQQHCASSLLNAASLRAGGIWDGARARVFSGENQSRADDIYETVPSGQKGRGLARTQGVYGGSHVDKEFMERLNKSKLKTCNCRKSRCLKQYCECFREKEFCSSLCNCMGCLNLPGKHDVIEAGENSAVATVSARLLQYLLLLPSFVHSRLEHSSSPHAM